MKMDDNTKGYVYALTALCFLVLWPIFAKKGMSLYNVETTLAMWFTTAAIFSLILVAISGRNQEYKSIKTHWKWIIILGLVTTTGIIINWTALSIIEPGMHNFFMKISLVMIILSGTILLKERFNIYEALSALAIICGVILMSYFNGNLVLKGLLLVTIWSVIFTCQRTIVKSKFKTVKPLIITTYRSIAVAFFAFTYAVVSGRFAIDFSPNILYITLPSILSAVIAHTFIFKAYKLLDMSKVELMIAVEPFIVLFISYLVFGETMSAMQLLGGVVVVAGAIGLILSKNAITASSKKHKSSSM